jgi:hypothetical protein
VGIPERIYRISKAYLNQIKDRIDDKLTDAERELDGDDRDDVVNMPTRDDTSPDAMMRRAEARIASARRELESRTELRGDVPQGPVTAPPAATTPAASKPAGTATETDPNQSEYRLMGVPVGSDLVTVQAAYEKLARRCDPRRFPDGSTEQKEAELILKRINAAFEILKKRLDPTESRFGKLELE